MLPSAHRLYSALAGMVLLAGLSRPAPSAEPFSSLPAEAQSAIAQAIEKDVSFTELAVLGSTDQIVAQSFGRSVAISGSTVVVGAPADHEYNQNSTPGAAYVFVKPANGWRNMTQVAKLTASDGQLGDYFGFSVAINGNTIAVGAPNHTVPAKRGAVYVFVQPPGGWTNMTQTAELTASNPAAVGALGFSVAMTASTLVAGAISTDVGNNASQGAAYVFVKPPNGWRNSTETAQLTSSDATFRAAFGNAVAILGDTIAVADVGQNFGGGAVYVFVKPANGWSSTTQTAKLTPADEREGGGFAGAVAMSAGAIVANEPGARIPGWVDVFVEPQGGWTDMTAETARLSASDGTANDGFGLSLAMAGNVAVAGAPGNTGAAYVFVEPPGGWMNMTETAKLQGAIGQTIGWSVGLSATTVVSGAPTTKGVGAACLFGAQ